MPNEPTVTQIDAARAALAVHQIRESGAARRLRLREQDIRDTSDRLRVLFARFLFEKGLDRIDVPSDAFLRDGATTIYNAIHGVTSGPRRAL